MKKIVYFFIFSFLILAFMQSKSKAFADSVYWSMSSNNDVSIIWGAGMRYYPCPIAGCGSPSPIWHPLISRTGISGVNRYVDGTNTVSGGGGASGGYRIQWGTSCKDPITVAVQYNCGVNASCYYIPTANVTVPNTAGLTQFVNSGGGTIPFGSSFSDMSNCPVACTNQCTANARQCSGNASQTCQTGSNGCTSWVTTTNCTSDCDNGTGQCRRRGCSSGNACVWVAGNGSDGCTTSANCSAPPPPPPPPVVNCDFTTPERRMIDSCTYQTCQAPSPGSWGPNQSCAPNQTLTAVGNAFKYSCTNSPGSCTAPPPPPASCTFQQCSSGSCQTFSGTNPPGCPATNCNACSGGSC